MKKGIANYDMKKLEACSGLIYQILEEVDERKPDAVKCEQNSSTFSQLARYLEDTFINNKETLGLSCKEDVQANLNSVLQIKESGRCPNVLEYRNAGRRDISGLIDVRGFSDVFFLNENGLKLFPPAADSSKMIDPLVRFFVKAEKILNKLGKDARSSFPTIEEFRASKDESFTEKSGSYAEFFFRYAACKLIIDRGKELKKNAERIGPVVQALLEQLPATQGEPFRSKLGWIADIKDEDGSFIDGLLTSVLTYEGIRYAVKNNAKNVGHVMRTIEAPEDFPAMKAKIFVCMMQTTPFKERNHEEFVLAGDYLFSVDDTSCSAKSFADCKKKYKQTTRT